MDFAALIVYSVEDICPTKALHVHGRISSTDLFDLEPVVLKRHDE